MPDRYPWNPRVPMNPACISRQDDDYKPSKYSTCCGLSNILAVRPNMLHDQHNVKRKKVKQSRYRLGVAQRVPGS